MEKRYENVSKNIIMSDKFSRIGCDCCVIPHDYKSASFKIADNGKRICNYCENHILQKFDGLDCLKKDIDLKENEKIGIMVSGGKDGLYAWMTLCEIYGGDRVIAFNHHKSGMVHELAYKNILNASKILNSEVVIVRDDEFLPRFKKNLESFLRNPDPAMVRVALCAGCRYGITGELYEKAYLKYNIKKFVSAASYLELAPFKGELLKEKGNGNSKYGLIRGLAENVNYNFPHNIEVILRDDNLEYKAKNKNGKVLSQEFRNYQLFDFDNYFPNNPEKYEKEVKEKLNWQRPERSWHFDCLAETFKDFFYYGLLGYTETEFKLSQMIRYNLLTREEALKQLESYYETMDNSINDILGLLKDMGIGMIVFSPLAEGLLTDRYLNGIPADSRAARATGHLKKDSITPEKLSQIQQLNDIARQRNQTLAQMSISWLLRNETVTSVLIGASSPQQLKDNLKAQENIGFSDEELSAIDKILK